MAGPITSSTDLWAFVPEHLQNDNQPVLDDATEALAEICLEWQTESEAAAAAVDLGQATDQFLTGLAADREVQRQPGESDATLLLRTTQAPAAVTPEALYEIINPVLATYGASPAYCRIIDSVLDRAYVYETAGIARGSFVQNDETYEAFPEYIERLYSPDTSVPYYRSCSRPVGMHIFNDHAGRKLMILVPPPANQADTQAMVAILVNAVTLAIGQAIRWSLWVSPAL
jgi:hypothetical protein